MNHMFSSIFHFQVYKIKLNIKIIIILKELKKNIIKYEYLLKYSYEIDYIINVKLMINQCLFLIIKNTI